MGSYFWILKKHLTLSIMVFCWTKFDLMELRGLRILGLRLLNRTQYCSVNGNQSGLLTMKIGIPQGIGVREGGAGGAAAPPIF